MEIEQVKELMRKAFVAGKKTYLCDEDTMELWIADELSEFVQKASLEDSDE